MSARLFAYNVTTGNFTEPFRTATTVVDPALQTVSDNTPIGSAVIDNTVFAYQIELIFGRGNDGDNARFHGCIISYD